MRVRVRVRVCAWCALCWHGMCLEIYGACTLPMSCGIFASRAARFPHTLAELSTKLGGSTKTGDVPVDVWRPHAIIIVCRFSRRHALIATVGGFHRREKNPDRIQQDRALYLYLGFRCSITWYVAVATSFGRSSFKLNKMNGNALWRDWSRIQLLKRKRAVTFIPICPWSKQSV